MLNHIKLQYSFIYGLVGNGCFLAQPLYSLGCPLLATLIRAKHSVSSSEPATHTVVCLLCQLVHTMHSVPQVHGAQK